MRHVLRAGAELKHRKNLGAGIDGQPEPEDLFGAVEPGAEFVQLQVREVEMAEEALVQGVRVPACTSEPRRDGGLPVTEDPFGSGSIQPKGSRGQHHGDVVRGGFQTGQGRVASSSERAVAGRASKGLDPRSRAMGAIPDEGVDSSVCNPGVLALLVGTGEALGVYPLGCSPPAFHLTPGAYWCRGRSHTGGGEATDGTIKRGAWFEKTLHRGAHSCSF